MEDWPVEECYTGQLILLQVLRYHILVHYGRALILCHDNYLIFDNRKDADPASEPI